MPVNTVPDNVKRNVRAVLLSKVGGVLVSDLVKDYKSLLKEPLKFKDLGFSTIKEFVEAMPEVCRLEYDEGIMAHKLYGVGDKSTYMSLSQKRAEKSKQNGVSNGKKNAKGGSAREVNPELLPNSRGLYTLCYPRTKEAKSFEEKDLQEKFSEFGNLAQINMIPGLFFLRFATPDSAQAALDRYETELELRPAAEKTKHRNYQNENQNQDRRKSSEEVTTDKDFNSNNTNDIEVFVGNIPYECDQEAFKAEITSSCSPLSIRIKTAKGNDKKIFRYAFVKFPQKSQADDFISKYSDYDYHGRNLIVRYSNPGPPPNYKQGGAESGGKPAKSKNRPPADRPDLAFEEEEEKWDDATESSGASVWGKIPREPATSPELPHVMDIMSDQIQEQSPPVNAMEELHINTDFHIDTNFHMAGERNSPALSLHSQRSRRQVPSPAASMRSQGGESQSSVLRGTNPQPAPKARRHQQGRYPYREDSLDEMPSLEPAGLGFGPPPLQPIAQEPQIFISNFPYGESDEELIDFFSQYGCYDVIMMNRNDPKCSTRAMLYVANMQEAERAVLECNQMTYKGRRLLVNISKHIGNQTVNFLSSYHSMDKIKCTVTSDEGRKTVVEASADTGPGGDVLRRAESVTSNSSLASSQGDQSEPAVKSWNALLQTYKIIMNTLQIRPYMKKPPAREIVIYVTSVFDQNNFWGQLVLNESSLNELSEVMTGLQNKENRIGPTKGLGRCAALYNKEWYRAWIVGEKTDFRKVNVFFVDYGNTSTLDRKMTSLTSPYIWETKPILQPFTISGTPEFEVQENMIVSAQVSRFGHDESGYVTEVILQEILQ
uniref:Uncharacterized protein LOC111129501 isoform X2 n=1 Tax=Crassostrea virginica TaxID=6565 RepID=A0A8B8DTS3_CRAVI|nr:uncharacterized protein LOC111129501 isoform X2 [Crassostrea virginica]